ncbi:hypothetical protein ACFE04_028499 [Oxalis oulophora]
MAISGLHQFNNRSVDGVPILDAENGEELMLVQPNVSVVFGDRSPETSGTLYITTKQVIWLSDVDINKGYAVDFLSISLHAVSRDPQAYPFPCIYAQIEREAEGDDSDDEFDAEESSHVLNLSKVAEIRLVPSDPNQVDTLFQVFLQCAELNPEPTEDAEEGNNWIFSADQMDEVADMEVPEWATTIGYSNGDHNLFQRVSELQIDDQCFEDAEEPEHEVEGDRH